MPTPAEPTDLQARHPWALRVVQFDDDGCPPGTSEPRWFPPRAQWGAGPWQTEPDLVEWRFSGVPGYPLLILRGGMGQLNGYVGVPPGHPLHGGERSRSFPFINWDCECGGLRVPTGEPPVCWWLGFDCGHGAQYCPATAAGVAFFKGLAGLAHRRATAEAHYVDLDACRKQVEGLALLLLAVDTEEKLAQFQNEQEAWMAKLLALIEGKEASFGRPDLGGPDPSPA